MASNCLAPLPDDVGLDDANDRELHKDLTSADVQEEEDECSEEEKAKSDIHEEEVDDVGALDGALRNERQNATEEVSEERVLVVETDDSGMPATLNMRKASGTHPVAPATKQVNSGDAHCISDSSTNNKRQHVGVEGAHGHSCLVKRSRYKNVAATTTGETVNIDETEATSCELSRKPEVSVRRLDLQRELVAIIDRQDFVAAALLKEVLEKGLNSIWVVESASLQANVTLAVEWLHRRTINENINAMVTKGDYAGAALLMDVMPNSQHAALLMGAMANSHHAGSTSATRVVASKTLQETDAVLAVAMKTASDVGSVSDPRALTGMDAQEKKTLRRRKLH